MIGMVRKQEQQKSHDQPSHKFFIYNPSCRCCYPGRVETCQQNKPIGGMDVLHTISHWMYLPEHPLMSSSSSSSEESKSIDNETLQTSSGSCQSQGPDRPAGTRVGCQPDNDKLKRNKSNHMLNVSLDIRKRHQMYPTPSETMQDVATSHEID